MQLDGRVAIVTGASRGIGKALARGLAAEGAAVVCAARTVAAGESELPGTVTETAHLIAASGGQALPVRCDVSDVDDLQGLVDETIAHYGRVDVLVNNAMAPTRAPFDAATLEEWEASMSANVRSLFVLAKLVVPRMAAVGGGSIINVSSGGADHAAAPFMPPGFLTYAVAKAAMERFTSGLAPEVRERGVAVNALRPGAVKTELATVELGEDHDWTGWTAPEAVVPAVVFLATRAGTDFTGKIVDSTQYGQTWP